MARPKKTTTVPQVKGKVYADATMAAAHVKGQNSKALSQAVEEAMSAAIRKAMSEGVTEPAKIKERMMAERERVLNSIRK